MGRYDGQTYNDILDEYKNNNIEDFTSYDEDKQAIVRDITETDVLKADITWPLGFGYDDNFDLLQGTAQKQISVSLEGAFLFPEFQSQTQLLTNSGKDQTYYEVPVGGSVTIPLVFQYFLTSMKPSVSKTIYFDIKPSVLSNIEHYKLQINARYSSTQNAVNTNENVSTPATVTG